MMDEIAEFRIDFQALNLRRNLIGSAMGYRSWPTPEPVQTIIDEILASAPEHTEIRAGYSLLRDKVLRMEEDGIGVNGVYFHTGKVITKPLRKISRLVIFAASAGKALDEWSRRYFNQGDPLRGYVIDTLGSEIAEAAADWIEAKIFHKAAAEGLGCSNRYSPGYCGWPVAEQHQLFTLLPENFCGISLTDSALMIPMKSVSGVIGMGSGVKKRNYPCRICDEEDCFRRREEETKRF